MFVVTIRKMYPLGASELIYSTLVKDQNEALDLKREVDNILDSMPLYKQFNYHVEYAWVEHNHSLSTIKRLLTTR